MWAKWVVAAAAGACYKSYTPQPCPSDATNRCLPYHTVQHTQTQTNTECPAGGVNISRPEQILKSALFSAFIERQKNGIALVEDEEMQCAQLGTDACTCFESSDLRRLIDASTLEKTELTYATVAAACGNISTTKAEVIAEAALKSPRAVAHVARVDDVPVGTYAFSCENTGDNTFYVVKENRLLAQANPDAATQPFVQGLFRDVALSTIAGCECNNAQITRLVAMPATLKPAERVPSNDVWYDTSVCRDAMTSCLVEEMERPCTPCPPGMVQERPCGLFYDTVCGGKPYTAENRGMQDKADPTIAYILAGFLVTGALLLILGMDYEHSETEPSYSTKPKTKKGALF